MPRFRNQAGELAPFKLLHYQILLVPLQFVSKGGEKENGFKEHRKELYMAFLAFFSVIRYMLEPYAAESQAWGINNLCNPG